MRYRIKKVEGKYNAAKGPNVWLGDIIELEPIDEPQCYVNGKKFPQNSIKDILEPITEPTEPCKECGCDGDWHLTHHIDCPNKPKEQSLEERFANVTEVFVPKGDCKILAQIAKEHFQEKIDKLDETVYQKNRMINQLMFPPIKEGMVSLDKVLEVIDSWVISTEYERDVKNYIRKALEQLRSE